MVANAKRRDARKLKFGEVQHIPAVLLLKTTLSNESGVAPIKKSSKLDDNAVEPLSQHFINDPEVAVTDPGDPATLSLPSPPRTARFICFVGRTTFPCETRERD